MSTVAASTPHAARFRSARETARSLISVATQRTRPGRSVASESEMHPVPHPTSRIRTAGNETVVAGSSVGTPDSTRPSSAETPTVEAVSLGKDSDAAASIGSPPSDVARAERSASAAARSASAMRWTSAFQGSSTRLRSGFSMPGIVLPNRSSTNSTSISVSGRGMSTPGSHATVSDLNGASPTMYCSGSPFTRRTTASCMNASSSGESGWS